MQFTREQGKLSKIDIGSGQESNLGHQKPSAVASGGYRRNVRMKLTQICTPGFSVLCTHIIFQCLQAFSQACIVLFDLGYQKRVGLPYSELTSPLFDHS